MDSNHCLTGLEPLVMMGLEPIRDKGGNKMDNKRDLQIMNRFYSLVQFFKKDAKTNWSIKD